MIFKKIKGFFQKKIEVMDGIEIVDLGIFDDMEEHYRDAMINTGRSINNMKAENKKRIPIQPIEIIHDLEIGVNFPIDKVKEAIKELGKRIEFTKKNIPRSSVRDDERALDMLKARLKYPKFAHLFRYKTTTLKHIEKLIEKYELSHKGISDYMRAIPALAITCMQRYTEILSKVSKEKPDFTLIAPPKYFKDPKNYSDPILLAKSPFGQFYYILTAWDKEIGLVSELLDGEELIINKNGNGKFKSKDKKELKK